MQTNKFVLKYSAPTKISWRAWPLNTIPEFYHYIKTLVKVQTGWKSLLEL